MKEYLKVVLKNFVELIKSIGYFIILVAYLGLCVYFADKSLWFSIPIGIITLAISCLLVSIVSDKSLVNYMYYLLIGIAILVSCATLILVLIGTLVLIIWLLKISLWFSIPIFVVCFLISSYFKYRKEKK